MATEIQLSELVNGDLSGTSWVGTGIFDTFIDAFNKNIETQFDQGRIVANDYATVYLGGIQTAMQQAIEFLLRQKELEAKIDQIKTETKLPLLNLLLSGHVDLYSKKQLDALTELVKEQTTLENIFNEMVDSSGMDAGIKITPAD
jgi:hypothetical protein